MSEVTSCTFCPLHLELPVGCTPIPGSGPTSSIMFVADFPSKSDIIQGELLSGRVGKYFDKLLARAEIDREKVYVSSLIHCWPTNKNKERQPTKDEINSCKVWVWREIQKINPKVVVTLGLTPTKALGSTLFNSTTKLSEIVGKDFQLNYHSAILFPCYHPKYVMTRSSKMENETVQALCKVKEFVDGSSLSSRMG